MKPLYFWPCLDSNEAALGGSGLVGKAIHKVVNEDTLQSFSFCRKLASFFSIMPLSGLSTFAVGHCLPPPISTSRFSWPPQRSLKSKLRSSTEPRTAAF